MALQDELAPYGDEVDLVRDRVLVARSQDGDGSAFAELYTRYHNRLRRFCYRRLHDDDEAADVTQEAFTRAWRALPRFAGERRFYPWLTVIAGNLCTDVLRKRARSQPTGDIDALGHRDRELASGDCTEESVMATVDGELVAQALTRLSERHRRVLTMREADGFTYQEIASQEGVEISTIETLLWRARQALKREYGVLSGGALGGIVLVAGSMRRFGIRLARRASLLPVGRGGGAMGPLAAAVTSAVVATATFLPPAPSGTAASAPTPAAQSVAAPLTPLNGGAGSTTPSLPVGTSVPSSTPSAVVTGSSPTTPTSSGNSATTSTVTTTQASAPTGTATTAGAEDPSVTFPTSPSVSWTAASGAVQTITQPVTTTLGQALSGASGHVPTFLPSLAPTLGAVTSAATTAASSATGQVTPTITSTLGRLGLQT